MPGERENLLSNYSEVLNDAGVLSEESLLRMSKRAYPAFIVGDPETWFDIQKNGEKAHLALSPEEERILSNVLSAQNTGKRYPLFINGRAGSGKSTILQYIFADYLFDYISKPEEERLPNPPIYITYSEELLELARSTVLTLITKNPRYYLRGYVHDKNQWEKVSSQAFKSYKNFLLELLPPDKRSKYALDKRMDFNRFKKEWDSYRKKHQLKNVNEISSELAWHVIRVYIKGASRKTGEPMEPDYYEREVPRKRKTVTAETFRLVYEHAWKGFYKAKCDEGFWDEQDLLLEIMNSETETPRFPAIFCDEAQDFTSMELEFLMSLSLFRYRRVPGYLLKNIPFAFAGDPLQTVNPTGFCWEAVKSMFQESIIYQLDPGGRAGLDFNFNELTLNYRSSEEIVKFCNLLQLLRSVVLGLKELQPQKTWSQSSTVSPFSFLIENTDCQQKIREQQELVIIVPCQEDGEEAYKSADKFLQTLKGGNILSPARAKGLEFERVVLYRFGDKVLNDLRDFAEMIREQKFVDLDSEDTLPWEYFLNQLYVAASRAKKRLFIVDSEKALKEFWAFTKIDYRSTLLKLYKGGKDWNEDDLGSLVPGDMNNWAEDRDNPEELANHFKNQGIQMRDPYLLAMAKQNFETCGLQQEARYCHACYLEFSNQFRDAADIFLSMAHYNEALRCYWAARDIESIIGMKERASNLASSEIYVAADLLNAKKRTLEQFEEVLAKMLQMDFRKKMQHEIQSWIWFVGEFIKRLVDLASSRNGDRQRLKQIESDFREVIKALNLDEQKFEMYPRLLHLCGEHERAISLWEANNRFSKGSEPTWIIECRAELAPYPDRLIYLDRLGRHDDILKEWGTHGYWNDNRPEITRIILRSAEKLNDINILEELMGKITDNNDLFDLLKLAVKTKSRTIIEKFPVFYMRNLAVEGEWEYLIEFAEGQKIRNYEFKEFINRNNLQWNRDMLLAASIKVLARATNLRSESRSNQNKVMEFLRKYLLLKVNPDQGRQILHYVTMEEGGAAFENTGWIMPALDYYEQWIEDSRASQKMNPNRLTEDVQRSARIRWIAAKLQLAEMSERDAERSQTQRRDHRKEAQEVANVHGINLMTDLEERELGALEFAVKLADDNQPQAAIPIEAPRKSSSEGKSPIQKHSLRETPATEMAGDSHLGQKRPASGTEGKPRKTDHLAASDTPKFAFKFRFNGLDLDGTVHFSKRRVLISNDDNHVTCGPDVVRSYDLDIVKADSADNIWHIKEWKMLCSIVNHENSVIIRFIDEETGRVLFGLEV